MSNLGLDTIEYNFGKFKIISMIGYLKLSIIIEHNNNYYYVLDERDKIIDISKMPFYIKEDWINYNRKDLDLIVINKHISYNIDDEDVYNNLLCIRRDFILTKYM